MARNLTNYANEGRKHITDRYDLSGAEMEQLYQMISASRDGLWDAIATSYRAGFEAGRRQTMNSMRKGARV